MPTTHIRCDGFSAAADAFALDERHLWFVSLIGHQQSVRALWARLLKGEAAILSDDALMGGRYCELAPEARGACHLHATRLPSTGATHALLVPDAALYPSDRRDFLLLAREQDDPAALHYRFLARRVDLPLHHLWSKWLWDRGLSTGEVRPLDASGVRAWRCLPDPEALQEALGRALRGHRVPLPPTSVEAAA